MLDLGQRRVRRQFYLVVLCMLSCRWYLGSMLYNLYRGKRVCGKPGLGHPGASTFKSTQVLCMESGRKGKAAPSLPPGSSKIDFRPGLICFFSVYLYVCILSVLFRFAGDFCVFVVTGEMWGHALAITSKMDVTIDHPDSY